MLCGAEATPPKPDTQPGSRIPLATMTVGNPTRVATSLPSQAISRRLTPVGHVVERSASCVEYRQIYRALVTALLQSSWALSVLPRRPRSEAAADTQDRRVAMRSRLPSGSTRWHSRRGCPDRRGTSTAISEWVDGQTVT